MHAPFSSDMVWAYDFVIDTTVAGQQIKCLPLIDECTKERVASRLPASFGQSAS